MNDNINALDPRLQRAVELFKKDPKTLEWVTRFYDAQREAWDVHLKKTNDYGLAFYETLEFTESLKHASGILYQKIKRFNNLINKDVKQLVTDEPLDDTLLDLANYAIMTLVFYRKKREEKQKEFEEANNIRMDSENDE